MITNTPRRIVNVWYILTQVFLIGIFVPSWIGMDGMDGGFGLSFLAGFMALLGIIIIFVYRSRAKQLDKILSGEGQIASWRYSPEEWKRFVVADFEAEKKLKRNLFLMVCVISVIIGIVLMLVVQNPIVIIIIAGLLVVVAIPAFWAPRYRFRKLEHSEAESLISERGVIVGKMFHLWTGLGARLDAVTLENSSDLSILVFQYSIPTRNGRQDEIARVPIPYGKLSEANWIVNHFNTLPL